MLRKRCCKSEKTTWCENPKDDNLEKTCLRKVKPCATVEGVHDLAFMKHNVYFENYKPTSG